MDIFSKIHLDKNELIPLYQQLGEQIFELIESGILTANQKLPPIRKLAEEVGVNRDTVVSAYRYLESKKAIYSQGGSGTFVSPIPIEAVPQPVLKKNLEKNFRPIINDDSIINFTSTSLPQNLFPVQQFKNAMNTLLEEEQGGAFSILDSQGYLPLRQILCKYIATYGIKTSPEHIQILSGAQQGIDIVSKAMVNYGDIVFTEKPTFYGAAGAFLNRGCQIIEIPMELDGLDVQALENLVKLYHPKFLYVMAYFQTPTGTSYSPVKKKKILDMAEKYDFYIIEDDNLYDFNYSTKEIVPFKAMDYKNRVIYIKSFSKILMPGLRIGFAVLPKKIINSITAAKYTTDISTSGFLQKALYLYLKENTWKKHIKEIHDYGWAKYKLTIKYADRYLKPYLNYNKPDGGISLWLDTKEIPSEQLLKVASDKNVILSHGDQFFITGHHSNFLRLCFINATDQKLEAGIRRLGDCAKHFTY